MRRSVLLACVALLAGCGEGEDFTVDVAMSPGMAKVKLAQLDGGMTLRALGLPLIKADQATKGELSFVLPGDNDSGTLRLVFEETGANASRIHVALALPAERMTIEGQQMVLVESMAEEVLERELRGWASDIGKTRYASLDSLNQTLGGISIALRPAKLNEVLAAAKDPSKLEGLIDPSFMAGMEASERAAYASNSRNSEIGRPSAAGAPAMDPNRSVAAASRPTNDAKGVEPTAQLNPGRY